MERKIGACGLVCSECEAYKATQADDMVALQAVVDHWKVEYGNPGFTLENVACDACMSASERRCSHCSECDTRQCVVDKGIANCGECADYESCQRIAEFFKYVPSAKIVLDEIHAAL